MNQFATQLNSVMPGDLKTRQVFVDGYNALVPQLIRQKQAVGATQDEIDQIKPISMEQVATPEGSSGIMAGLRSFFTGVPTAPPANPNNISTDRKTTLPPSPTGSVVPSKTPKAKYPSKRDGEGAKDYIVRMKKTLKSTDEIANAVEQEYPALVTK
jgi:hypothetical protein